MGNPLFKQYKDGDIVSVITITGEQLEGIYNPDNGTLSNAIVLHNNTDCINYSKKREILLSHVYCVLGVK